MNWLFVFGAKYALIIPILLWAWYLWKMRLDKHDLMKTCALLFLTMILTYILGFIAKHLYYDSRPFIIEGFAPLIPHVPDNGFPSDHALLAGALASASLFTSNKKLAIYTWILAIFIAYSRVFVGVHHLLDVFASLIFALIASALVQVVLVKRLDAIISRIK